MRKPLTDYLAMPYSFTVELDADVGFFASYPDLRGRMTQVERAEEIGPAAEEIRVLWLETAYAHGLDFPEPAAPERHDAPPFPAARTVVCGKVPIDLRH
jgi:predicted RNase H-like HicB family nuclease